MPVSKMSTRRKAKSSGIAVKHAVLITLPKGVWFTNDELTNLIEEALVKHPGVQDMLGLSFPIRSSKGKVSL